MVRIEAVTEATPDVHAALAKLLPQLNAQLPIPTMERLRALIADPSTILLLARDFEEILGTATVIVYTTPSGSKLASTRSLSTRLREAGV